MTQDSQVPRTVLPIPERGHVGLTTYDAKDPDTAFPPIEPVRPPKGAPNVLIVMIDDCGFGASSAFGGPCATPNTDALAANGLKYNRFHTTALCSPSRAALLTGRNHHAVGMGGITEIATAAPGYSSVRPKNSAPLAETLKLNGYSTAQFGKCHEVPVWQSSPMGPFDHWPTGSGFEYFYGFVGGETNQWYPALYAGFLEHTDHHIGRLLDAIGDLGVLDDTLIVFMIGDNGASALNLARFDPIISSSSQRILSRSAVRNSEGTPVGRDTGTPVSEDYTSATSEFTGKVKWVQLDAGDDNHDHLISPDELMRVATSIQ